jgi:5'-nucleotidase
MTTITIVHFNDVYNIEPGTQEPVGGAARFVTAVQRLSDRNPLILFSGDALNPSLMSTVTLGHQMIPILNAIGVHCALYGNHDFDFGVENLTKVSSSGYQLVC